jgi:hypothetical protein
MKIFTLVVTCGTFRYEASRSHSLDTPHSVGLFWRSDQPLPDNTQHSHEINIHAPAGFEPTIPVSEWPQIHALDRAATGIGKILFLDFMNLRSFKSGKELNSHTKIKYVRQTDDKILQYI